MTIKIYYQNGKVKVTKLCGHMEHTMFSDIQEGEMVEIETVVSQATKSHKKKIGSVPGPDTGSGISVDRTLTALSYLSITGVDYEDDVKLAIDILEAAKSGNKPENLELTDEQADRIRNEGHKAETLFEKVTRHFEWAKQKEIIGAAEVAEAMRILASSDHLLEEAVRRKDNYE